MPRGGARTRSGPAPDPNALARERDAGDWMELPAEGRTDPAPAWPLPQVDPREEQLWADLWSKPQALMWERNGSFLEVALYVRRFSEAEVAMSPTNLSTLVRQMGDSLGLTTPGMRANRWKIVADEVAEKRTQKRAPARKSAKARLKVVSGAGGA